MKTHIDVTHAYLVAKRKLKLTAIVAAKQLDTNHNQKLKKRKVALSMSIIKKNLAQQIFTRMVMKRNNASWKIWSFTFAKEISLYHHAKTSSCIG
jgi:hypothetical protein